MPWIKLKYCYFTVATLVFLTTVLYTLWPNKTNIAPAPYMTRIINTNKEMTAGNAQPRIDSDVIVEKKALDSRLSWLAYDRNCAPLHNIARIYNRKTASTTLDTLLGRFARKHKFQFKRLSVYHEGEGYSGASNTYHVDGSTGNVSLPAFGANRKNRVLLLRENATLHFAASELAHLYQRTESPGVIFVATAREPAAQFESAFNFFKLYKYVNCKNISCAPSTLQEFLRKPEYYHKRMENRNIMWQVARNSQAWHLGLENQYHDNPDVVEKYFTILERELDLVVITEYFDESLVLLKRLMCWKMEDILYIARRVSKKHSILGPDLQQKIYQWNKVDVKIYEIFNASLWRKIQQYGPNFDKDLQDFRYLQDAVTSECDVEGRLSQATVALLASFGSVVTDKFCKNLYARYKILSDLSTQGQEHGTGAYAISTKVESRPFSKLNLTNSDNKQRCMSIFYREATPESDRRTLDVYFSTSGSAIPRNGTVWKSGENAFIAAYDLGSPADLQVTTTGRYSDSKYLIDSVCISRGLCEDSVNSRELETKQIRLPEY
ncbi:galactosylceramide sulfotransferase-like [Ptychodera flava]|uniref:galactosylceramide sulfotransferase-like n=1 Tax=Ptychodera flava TaxID=63121 RepID=UPI00396A2577